MPKTTSIQVNDIPAGQGGTSDLFQSLLYEEMVTRLMGSRCFRQVLRAGEIAPDSSNLLVLELSTMAFQEGKPRVRELTGYAGKARVTARVVLKNRANEVLRDSVLSGVAAGQRDSLDACRILSIREAKSFESEP